MEIHVNSFTLACFAHGWTWVFATAAYYAAQAGAKVHPATCDIQDVYNVHIVCSLCDQGSVILFWCQKQIDLGYP